MQLGPAGPPACSPPGDEPGPCQCVSQVPRLGARGSGHDLRWPPGGRGTGTGMGCGRSHPASRHSRPRRLPGFGREMAAGNKGGLWRVPGLCPSCRKDPGPGKGPKSAAAGALPGLAGSGRRPARAGSPLGLASGWRAWPSSWGCCRSLAAAAISLGTQLRDPRSPRTPQPPGTGTRGSGLCLQLQSGAGQGRARAGGAGGLPGREPRSCSLLRPPLRCPHAQPLQCPCSYPLQCSQARVQRRPRVVVGVAGGRGWPWQGHPKLPLAREPRQAAALL